MWQHNYTPIHGSLLLSSVVAALPIFVLLFLLGVRRTPAWIAAIFGLGTTALVSFFLYGMPVERIVSAAAYGAAYGWFPIGWIVIWAVYLYRLTLDTGKFETIKHSLRSLTRDPRLQTLLIAFAFGAFLEGAAGFGTPVAVAAAMLAGLGFSPFHAAAICLLANTAPVAFGSIAIPIVTLAGITGLPLMRLSAGVGRICAPVSLIVPAYLVVVMGGWGALARVFPAALLCGVTFAGLQFAISNFVGPAAYRPDCFALRAGRVWWCCSCFGSRKTARSTSSARQPRPRKRPNIPSDKCSWPGARTFCWSSAYCCGAGRPC